MNSLFILIGLGLSAAYFLAKGETLKKDAIYQEENAKQIRTRESTIATMFGRLPAMFVGNHPQVTKEGQSFYNQKPMPDYITFLPPPQGHDQKVSRSSLFPSGTVTTSDMVSVDRWGNPRG